MDLIQLGWLESKVEEVKKENQILRSMLNQVTQQHYALLQNKFLVGDDAAAAAAAEPTIFIT